ncbi:helix-turn-helix domain-containing protein [Streptomyces bauhiniae]
MQIRRLREERGYSLEELAERSGLSFRGLIYIEHGQRSRQHADALGYRCRARCGAGGTRQSHRPGRLR